MTREKKVLLLTLSLACLLPASLAAAAVPAPQIQAQAQASRPFRLAATHMRYDSMAILPNGKFYATIGSQYIRASFPNLTIDPGYPKPIQGNWGPLPASFNAGFDSMTVLPNGSLYVTKGGYYVKYTDAYGTKIAPGYPKPIAGNWGNLPTQFNSGFDAMESFGGKTYVTQQNLFVRYSDKTASRVDPGYPKLLN